MALLVATLTLPYTVGFETELESVLERAEEPIELRKTRQDRPDKFLTSLQTAGLVQTLASRIGGVNQTPPPTPGINEDANNFFFKDYAKTARTGTDLSNASASEPSPGIKKALTQPRSRASSPPPVSVLQSRSGNINEVASKSLNKLVHSVGLNKLVHPLTATDPTDGASKWSDKTWTIEKAHQGNGGLRNAVNAAKEFDVIEEVSFIGLLGMPTDELDEEVREQIVERLRDTDFNCQAVIVKDSDAAGHYDHYCKQILWPVFHYQIPDNPKSKAYEDHSWVFYEAVNKAFADTIVKNYKANDVIWIHDYHLLLVPQMVRARLPEAKIGFFLHVAFPSSEIFRCLATRKELLEGMLGANLIGFQTEEYTRHFLQTCSRLLLVESTPDGIVLEDRFVNVISMPIGIDPVALDKRRKAEDVKMWVANMKEKFGGTKLFVSRDKLDHVRGVRQKLLAFEMLLDNHPKWRGHVRLLQVALTTSATIEQQSSVSSIVTRINSRYRGVIGQEPVVFLHQDISFDQYLGILTVADALIITSLREGMNLTSHEFIFCQEQKHGPLILSEFTGSASVFKGNELAVNPWDTRQCADAMFQALEMSEEEKTRRWQDCFKAVSHHTATHWVRKFLLKLDSSWESQRRRGSTAIPRLRINKLIETYQASTKRLFLLDFEGTMISLKTKKNSVQPNLQRPLDALSDLLVDARNIVYVMSPRTTEEMDRTFARVAGVGLVAENGCHLRQAYSNEWIKLADGKDMSWKKSVSEILKYYEERVPGSASESRDCSYIYDYSNSDDSELASRQAAECANHVNDACESQRIHAVPLTNAVLVEMMDWNKGTAGEKILSLHSEKGGPPNFLFVAGDDRDDEPVFKWANELGKGGKIKSVVTVCVSSRNTEAMATLTQGVTGVISTLQKLVSMK